MRIVVLGATGQIGSVIYNGLLGTCDVTGTSRKGSPDFVAFDPFQEDWRVLGTADVVVNCIGQIQAARKNDFYHIHAALTQRILAHRHQIGNPKIIQVSALGASAAHPVEFLRTKGIADDLLLQHPDTAVIRPSIVCTHRTMIVRKLLMLSRLARLFMGLLPVPKGFVETKIQPVMPHDLLDLVLKICFDRNTRTVNAVGPEAISFYELIQMMMETRAQKFRILEVPKRLSDLIVKNLVSGLLPGIVSAQQYQLLFEDNVADIRTMEEFLGRPLTSTRPFFKNEFIHAID